MREVTEAEMMALAQSIKPGGANALAGASANYAAPTATSTLTPGAAMSLQSASGTTNALTNGIAQPVQSLAINPSSKSPGGATLAAPPASFAAPVGVSPPAMISSAMASPLSQGSASFRANGPLAVPYRSYSVTLPYQGGVAQGYGMPEPLTARKSSKPCCDDCGEAEALGKPKPCGGGSRIVPQRVQTALLGRVGTRIPFASPDRLARWFGNSSWSPRRLGTVRQADLILPVCPALTYAEYSALEDHRQALLTPDTAGDTRWGYPGLGGDCGNQNYATSYSGYDDPVSWVQSPGNPDGDDSLTGVYWQAFVSSLPTPTPIALLTALGKIQITIGRDALHWDPRKYHALTFPSWAPANGIYSCTGSSGETIRRALDVPGMHPFGCSPVEFRRELIREFELLPGFRPAPWSPGGLGGFVNVEDCRNITSSELFALADAGWQAYHDAPVLTAYLTDPNDIADWNAAWLTAYLTSFANKCPLFAGACVCSQLYPDALLDWAETTRTDTDRPYGEIAGLFVAALFPFKVCGCDG